VSRLDVNRRGFLTASGLVGGGLMLQMTLPRPALANELPIMVGSKPLNPYVSITSDGQITIYSSIPEMGQGINTSLPMIIAEELGARWEDVSVVVAETDAARYGLQGAGGSTSLAQNYQKMREMGASAREMMLSAAAEFLEVRRDELEVRESTVVHSSGESLTFGQLAAAAVRQPIPDPEQLSFRDPRTYTLIGKRIGAVDNVAISTGDAKFGIDVEIPGMKYASYTRCPRRGGTVQRFNEAEIRSLPGVLDAFIVEPDTRAGISAYFVNGLPELQGGVAIVGDDTWSVFRAKQKLKIEWDESNASSDSWQDLIEFARQTGPEAGGKVLKDDGGVDAALLDPANRTAEGLYQCAFVAHLCMEPMNCTVDYRVGKDGESDRMEIWMPSQYPFQVQELAKNMLGMPPEKIRVHSTRMGGAFGRRAIHDFAAEAIMISKISGVPVKLTWTREDDIHNDYFRAASFQYMKGAVSSDGRLTALDQHYVGVSHNGKAPTGSKLFGREFTLTGLDNSRVRHSYKDIITACGNWRAPSSNTNAFVEQSFIHELAVVADRDHVEFLIELMGERRWLDPGNRSALNTGRAIDCIERAAAEAGWGRDMPPDTALGLAFYFCHQGHVAQVAEVTVDEQRRFRVNKVTVAVDVGPIINMSGALGQVQGSIIDGLSAMAMQKITVEGGVIQEDNLDDYPVLRIASAPDVDVHFIQSDNPPTGLGEPALPPLAPAVTNAIFKVTGERIRTLPLSDEGYQLV